jgi:hypothetical protein
MGAVKLADLRYWAAWYWLRYRQAIALPVPIAAIQQFVVDHVQRKTATGLEASLPAAHDQALVDSGFKGKLGSPASATGAGSYQTRRPR